MSGDWLLPCVQLVFGNSGVLQGIGAGKAYVDMSTVDVETMADVFEARSVSLFANTLINSLAPTVAVGSSDL